MPNKRPPALPPLPGYRPGQERGPVLTPRKGPTPPVRTAQAHSPKRRRRSFLGGLLYTFGFLLLVAGASAGYLLLNPPSDLIREQLARQIKAKTGRDLIIAGPTTFSILPSLGVSMHDVTLSAPPEMGGKPLVTIATLDVAVKTSALIKGEVGVKQLVLKKPVFDLRIDKAGKKSWNFADAAAPLRFAQAETQEAPANDAAPAEETSGGGLTLPKKLTDIRKLQLGDVRIEDGTLRYSDERTGQVQELNAVNVKLALKSWTTPVTAQGDLVWHGEKTDFDGKLTNARTVLEEKPAKLEIDLTNRFLRSAYDGTVVIKDGAEFDGRISAVGDSARDLAHWLGTALPDVTGFGPYSLQGGLRTEGHLTSLTGTTIGLDGATANGDVSVLTGGVRPQVDAHLQISELDLNKYMQGGADRAPAAAKPAAPAPETAAEAPPPAQRGDEIEQLLNEPAKGPKVQGYASRTGWSGEPINLTLLGLADTNARLQIGRLIFKELKIGQSALSVSLKNKVMRTSFDKVQLYDGQGKGFLNVDASSGKAAAIGANFALDGVSALPFLTDAADVKWLSGKGKVALQLAAQGASQLQLVESLNGKADFAFADGAIVGFNLPGAIRNVSQGRFSELKQAPSEKTDFSELAASFTIAGGVAQNQDLRLTSPLLRLTGAGTVSLPPRTIDYTVKPKLVASLEGQQGAADLSGLEIPVRISGPWEKPKYEPDLKGVDTNKVVETVKELGKKYKGKSGKEIVDDLLGNGGNASDGATGSTDTKAKAKALLKNLLKPQ